MLRRIAPRRAAAATASGALALAGLGLVVLAPAAHAGTVTAQVHCVLPPLTGAAPVDGPQEITVDITPANVAPGGTVHVKVTQGESPAKTPPLGNGVAVHATPKMNLDMSGGAIGPATQIVGPALGFTPVTGEGVPFPPYEGDIRIPTTANGVINFSVNSMVTDTEVDGMEIDTQVSVCSVLSGGENIASVTVQGGGGPTDPATLAADSTSVYNGGDVDLSGTHWTPGATPSVALCNEDGTGCLASDIASDSLKIDTAGDLSGKATLRFGVTNGNHTIRVSDGAKLATTPVTVSAFVPTGPPTMTGSATSGPVGATVILTGENFPPEFPIYLDEYGIDGWSVSGTLATVIPKADGTWTLPWVIASEEATSIRAEVSTTGVYADVPFKVVPGVIQTVTASILPGNLAITQAGTGIDFGTVTLNGEEQKLAAALNQVTVVDARSGNLGWTLTGTMTDLTTPEGGNIPAGNVSWTPACAASETSPSAAVTGTPGPLGTTAATLCSQTADGATPTGGRFTADAALELTTPAFVTPGAYTATLTLSLS